MEVKIYEPIKLIIALGVATTADNRGVAAPIKNSD